MSRKIRNAFLVGLVTGLIIIVSQYINFRVQGDNYNFAIYVLIALGVAIVSLIIILILYKVYRLIKEKNRKMEVLWKSYSLTKTKH